MVCPTHRSARDGAPPRPRLDRLRVSESGCRVPRLLPHESNSLASSRLFNLFERPIRNLQASFAREAVIDLSRVPGEYTVEWFNPSSGETITAEPVMGGGMLSFVAPFVGDAVLYLKLRP